MCLFTTILLTSLATHVFGTQLSSNLNSEFNQSSKINPNNTRTTNELSSQDRLFNLEGFIRSCDVQGVEKWLQDYGDKLNLSNEYAGHLWKELIQHAQRHPKHQEQLGKIIEFLLSCGLNFGNNILQEPQSMFDFGPEKKVSPLSYAISNNATRMVEFLLTKGANPNQEDDEGTPLIAAVKSRNTNLIRTLLEHGANPSIQDDFGKNALDYVYNYPEITELLLDFFEEHGNPFAKTESVQDIDGRQAAKHAKERLGVSMLQQLGYSGAGVSVGVYDSYEENNHHGPNVDSIIKWISPNALITSVQKPDFIDNQYTFVTSKDIDIGLSDDFEPTETLIKAGTTLSGTYNFKSNTLTLNTANTIFDTKFPQEHTVLWTDNAKQWLQRLKTDTLPRQERAELYSFLETKSQYGTLTELREKRLKEFCVSGAKGFFQFLRENHNTSSALRNFILLEKLVPMKFDKPSLFDLYRTGSLTFVDVKGISNEKWDIYTDALDKGLQILNTSYSHNFWLEGSKPHALEGFQENGGIVVTALGNMGQSFRMNPSLGAPSIKPKWDEKHFALQFGS